MTINLTLQNLRRNRKLKKSLISSFELKNSGFCLTFALRNYLCPSVVSAIIVGFYIVVFRLFTALIISLFFVDNFPVDIGL